eukprot:TRINITY_DN2954_c2_g1_i1.p1 TRINITY_DN2954_c2_g1~~TRINITY_DN2954_c2_g1_i1.p1  ORF type:complete len:335 (+),score=58.62 TRINITY_DN2954_c2_g1_i1:1159-2163(+)
MAARPDSAKAQALLLRYQNASSLVTIHLLAVICPIMTQFSMCLQTENFCHFDLPSIKQHYITKLQDIKSNPASHPLYWGCATAVNDACVGHAGFAPINLGFVQAFHNDFGKRYVDSVVACVEERLVAAPVVAAMSALFDMRGPVHGGGDRSLAPAYLETILEFYKEPSPPPIPMKYGPFFDARSRTHLRNTLDAFLTDFAGCASGAGNFTAGVLSFLNQRLLRERHPEWTSLLSIALLLPLSNATTERLFSKLKILKTRLRANMLDSTLEDSFVINVEVDFTDLNGIQDKEVIKQVVSAFITGPDRKHSFAAYEGLQEAREWVAAWRQSFMDNL